MRLTIVTADNAVYVDGNSYSSLDLSNCGIPENVHALQWYDSYGEVEFKRQFVDGQIIHPTNEILTELPSWATTAKSVWDAAKIAFEEAQRIAAEQVALEQAALEAANTSTQTLQAQ